MVYMKEYHLKCIKLLHRSPRILKTVVHAHSCAIHDTYDAKLLTYDISNMHLLLHRNPHLWQVNEMFSLLSNFASEACAVISTERVAEYLKQKSSKKVEWHLTRSNNIHIHKQLTEQPKDWRRTCIQRFFSCKINFTLTYFCVCSASTWVHVTHMDQMCVNECVCACVRECVCACMFFFFKCPFLLLSWMFWAWLCGHMLFWVSYMHVFCIFAFALVLCNCTCFTWKGAQ